MKKIAYEEMFLNELTHPWYLVTRNLMLNFLKNNLNKHSFSTNKSARILDAGCGTGGTIAWLRKAGFRNVIGIDNNPYALAFCKKRGISEVKLYSVDQIPFGKESFDVVICMDVLYHQGVNYKNALKEFNRILKPGGLLYVQEPALDWLRGSHDKAIQTGHRFAKKELRELVINAHFNTVRCTYFNSFFLPPIMAMRLLGRIFRQIQPTSDVKELPYILNKFFLVILTLESKISEFFSLPFGLSIICMAQKKQ